MDQFCQNESARSMFQTFEDKSDPAASAERLHALRDLMHVRKIDVFLVPRADAHLGENVAPRDERLAWLTGFTGSAGYCIVAGNDAAIFVDGRYQLQVRKQVDQRLFAIALHPDDPAADWIRQKAPNGATVGFDPWLQTAEQIEELSASLASAGIVLKPVENMIDAIWSDQPLPPAGPIVAHPESLAGRTSADKRRSLAEELVKEGISATILTLPDSLSWLFNIRGSDFARTPSVAAFAILHDSGRADFFCSAVKLNEGIRDHLGADVTVHEPEELGPHLDRMTGRVAVDKRTAPLWVSDRLNSRGIEVVWRRDPCILPKACKTHEEIVGARTAHLRDGAAVIEFLAWLDAERGPRNPSEIELVRRLEETRAATGELQDLAFDTICGSGPNGAIVHYRVTEATNRAIEDGEIVLIDSGAQYRDGTTDITRTLAIGDPAIAAIRPYTLVLKGLIALSRLRFPEGCSGRDIDAIARQDLWRAGLDFDHGTGHGVGSFLSVHEGPQGISRRNTEALRPGMIVSNEPGYYREGAFGVRLENLLLVREPAQTEGGDRAMLSFETLTLVPFDRRLIDPALLTAEEIEWLDSYHRRVFEAHRSSLTSGAADWLDAACAPI
jgi:Xaa-Pro aminopeptidase